MITLPFGMSIDLASLLAGISLTAIAGWLTSFLALRKDERAIQMDQITKERTKWRDSMRKVTETIVHTYFENKNQPAPDKVAAVRARLVTSINPKDDKHDQEILSHFDELFSGSKSDVNVFTRRIALLLKHDWARVKWECTPIYVKFLLGLPKNSGGGAIPPTAKSGANPSIERTVIGKTVLPIMSNGRVLPFTA